METQTELENARAAAAEAGIALGHVGSLRDETGGKASRNRIAKIVVCTCGGQRLGVAARIESGVDDIARQSEIRMIEDVEELGAELQRETFTNLEEFANGKIGIPEAGAEDLVAAEVAEIPGGIRGSDGWILES